MQDFGELQVEILAKDNRDLLDLHFLSLPVEDDNASNLIINRSPLTDADFLSVWYWLLATGDSGLIDRFFHCPDFGGRLPVFNPVIQAIYWHGSMPMIWMPMHRPQPKRTVVWSRNGATLRMHQAIHSNQFKQATHPSHKYAKQ